MMLVTGAGGSRPHHGPYGGLGAAHDAVHAWCAGAGERITRTRWEVYGPNEPVPWTRVFWLLR